MYRDSELSQNMFSANEFEDSLNLAFGVVAPEGFDVMNNPYIDFKAYTIEYMHTSERIVETLELHKCSNEELLRYVKQKNIDLAWYPNPLCVKNRDLFGLHGNWNQY